MSKRSSQASFALIGLIAAGCNHEEMPPLQQFAASNAEFFSASSPAFELAFAGLLSDNASNRKRAFKLITNNWDAFRIRVSATAKDHNPSRRIACAYLYTFAGNKADLPTLRQLLMDRHPRVWHQALTAIVRLQDLESVPALESRLDGADYEAQRAIIGALCNLAPDIAERHCHAMAIDPLWANRRVATQSIAALQSASSAVLIENLLQDPIWLVVKDAVDTSGARKLNSNRNAVLSLANHKEWQVRAAVANTLASFANPLDGSVVAAIAENDPERYARQAAAKVLVAFTDEATYQAIIRVLKKPDEHAKVKRGALLSAMDLDAPRGLVALQTALKFADKEFRTIAVSVANSLGVSASRN
jgi:HEAT repeat protein